MLEGVVFHGALQVVVGAAGRREQALGPGRRRRLIVVLTRHPCEARQALRPTGLWVSGQAVIALLAGGFRFFLGWQSASDEMRAPSAVPTSTRRKFGAAAPFCSWNWAV